MSLSDISSFCGDVITEKPTNHLRLILQNPNGISAESDMFEFHQCLNQMKLANADIICLPETNLNWDHYKTHQTANKHQRNVFAHSKRISSNSTRTFDSSYQPGGTATILCEHIIGRFQSHSTDKPLGRWNIINLNIKHGRILSIVTCYQVCHQRISCAGPKTAYAQQWSLLRETHRTPNPRAQFIKDLDDLLSSFVTQNRLFILAGDFNDTLQNDSSSLSSLVTKYNLFDCVRHCHGSYSTPTYLRGTKTIDYILASPGLGPSITRSGIVPANDIIISDHRAVFIDICMSSSLGKPLSNLLAPTQRRLYSSNTIRKEQYIARLYSGIIRHNVLQRSFRLLHVPDYHRAIALAESIDRDMTRLMLSSEKKLHMHSRYSFSIRLSRACLDVRILKLQLRGKTTQAAILKRRFQSDVALPTSSKEIQASLDSARTKVAGLRENAVPLRHDFLSETSEDDARNKIAQRILKAEVQRSSHIKIKFTIKPNESCLVTKVQIPSDGLPPKVAQSWQTITDPLEVTNTLIQRNTQHFGSAAGTPFTVPPLSEDFDWNATTNAHFRTLSGNPPEYDNDLVNRILSRLVHTSHPCTSIPTITMSQLIRRLRKWKERTSTSPSGRHLGHYKSLLPPNKFSMNEYEVSHAGIILKVHLNLLNFCAVSGYSLSRWSKIVTTIIPKDHGSFKLHRLRVIHLYEADLTALLSTWSRRMVHHSEALNLLHPGSFGSRPGRTSTDPPYISLLQFETAHLSRTSLANAPNDASQCFDRIIPNSAVLSSMAHGMPPSAARCIGHTLSSARYFLKTSLCESSTYWSHSSTTPIYGTGQGSAISPSLCCITYSDLFHTFDSMFPGSKYQNLSNQNITTITNTSFVDDTTTSFNDLLAPSAMSTLELASHIQQHLQGWSDLLYIYGGKIEYSKTIVQFLTWDYSSDGTPFIPPASSIPISIYDSATHSDHYIQSTSAQEAYKVLGFHISPCLSFQTQFETLLAKAHKIANSVSGSSLSHKEALLAYFSVYAPAICYVLPLTCFNHKQCHQISSYPTRVFLQKSGFASTTHRSIVFGSRLDGGLGFRSLYIEQGLCHIIKLIQALRTPGLARDLTIIALQWLHINAGTGKPLLTYPDHLCPHLEGQWFGHTREFLSTVGGSLRTIYNFVPQPFRVGDKFLMDSIAAVTRFGKKRMRLINYCRLYLRVTFLSELTNSKGDALIPHFWKGDLSSRPAPPFQVYPRQQLPGPKSWSLWRTAIRLTFCHPRRTTLRRPLGDWIRLDHGRRFCISVNPVRLWERTSPQSHRYHILSTRTPSSYIFSHSSIPSTPPSSLIPADVTFSRNRIHTHIPSFSTSTPVPPPLEVSFSQSLRLLPAWKKSLLLGLHHLRPPHEVAALLSQSTSLPTSILAASDGGSIKPVSSFGWTIRCNVSDCVTCSGAVDCLDAGSFRAECYGLLSLLVYLELVLQVFAINCQPHIPIHLDNTGLISKVQLYLDRLFFSPAEAIQSERDVLLEIEHLVSSLPLPFSFFHVKSHQDDSSPLEMLSVPAQANVQADRLATDALSHVQPRSHPPLFPHAVCQLSIQSQPVTRKFASTIRRLSTQSALRIHMCRRLSCDVSDIDWLSLEAISKAQFLRSSFYVKFLHHLLPTAKLLHRRDPKASAKCPICPAIESNDHVFCCSHTSRVILKRTLLGAVRSGCSGLCTDPVLCDIVVEGCQSAITAAPFPCQLFSADYQPLIRAQSRIGWLNFLRGFHCCHWRVYHTRYVRKHRISSQHPHPIIQLVLLAIPHLQSLWYQRNDQRHSCDVASIESELERRTRSDLAELYSLRYKVLPVDRALFKPHLADHLKQSTPSIAAWISLHSSTITHSVQQASAENLHHTKPITAYFS